MYIGEKGGGKNTAVMPIVRNVARPELADASNVYIFFFIIFFLQSRL